MEKTRKMIVHYETEDGLLNSTENLFEIFSKLNIKLNL